MKTIPPFLPTNKKYVKKTDIEIAKYFTVGISSIDETYRISPPPNGVERIPYISWGGTYSIRSIHTTRVYIHTTRVYM